MNRICDRSWPVALMVSLVVTCASPNASFAAERSDATASKVRAAAAAAAVDRLIDERLNAERIPPSPIADDAEFLRRVTLDLTGRVPTYDEAVGSKNSGDLKVPRFTRFTACQIIPSQP